jgi:hypothetical protein
MWFGEDGECGCECCYRGDHIYDDFENGPTGAEQMNDDLDPNDEFDRELTRQAERIKTEQARRVRELEADMARERKSRRSFLFTMAACVFVMGLVVIGPLPWPFLIPSVALLAMAIDARRGFVRQRRRDRQARFDDGELV